MQERFSLALIDVREITVEFSASRFLEPRGMPHDTRLVSQAWFKSNKDGSPDRRFKGNYQIPVAEYGELHFGSAKGLNESYMISSVEKAKAFALAFSAYQTALRTFSSRTPAPPSTSDGNPAASSPASTATPTQGFEMKSVEWLRTRSAVGFEDGKDIILTFSEMLKADAESYNGQGHKPGEWLQFIGGLSTAMPALRQFVARSPGAKAAGDVALRELPKVIHGVFAAIEASVAFTKDDGPEHRALLEAVRKAEAELRQ
jgi:hypothetical protein